LSVLHGFETRSTAYRPVVYGSHLAVTCGHYLGSMAGMQMMAKGGNAVDAGVAAVFAQMVLEPQSAGFGGECPILVYTPDEGKVLAINGNCRAPAAATIEAYRALGVKLIPGDGFLAAGVPATPAALILALDRFGTLKLGDVLEPAIYLAGNGFGMYEALRNQIVDMSKRFVTEWPSSAELFLPGGHAPGTGELFRNPGLGATYRKLVEAERSAGGSRQKGLRAALERFYQGDIARAIVKFQQETRTSHDGGIVSSGLLTLEDLATYHAWVEPPVSTAYRGVTVYKCGPWTQGPVFLQQLNLLEGFNLHQMGVLSADYIHTVIECSKLAFADREQYYGDPRFTTVPLDGLLSKEYAAARRTLVNDIRASLEMRPGDPVNGKPLLDPSRVWPQLSWRGGTTGTRAADRHGNIFSATPSGGWLRSSPIIPGLGFCLGSRMQMFWLEPRHPSSLAPKKQPRTTLTPSIAVMGDDTYIAFGTPGGDQQDQWTLQFFLNTVDFGLNIQEAADLPSFHSQHLPGSFYPRAANPGQLVVEASVPPQVVEDLKRRGHDVVVARAWSQGNVTAARFDRSTGVIQAAATCRGQKAYAVGW
jgi:gamma-glutamyltranspeptidase/glutathione hydrolase